MLDHDDELYACSCPLGVPTVEVCASWRGGGGGHCNLDVFRPCHESATNEPPWVTNSCYGPLLVIPPKHTQTNPSSLRVYLWTDNSPNARKKVDNHV